MHDVGSFFYLKWPLNHLKLFDAFFAQPLSNLFFSTVEWDLLLENCRLEPSVYYVCFIYLYVCNLNYCCMESSIWYIWYGTRHVCLYDTLSTNRHGKNSRHAREFRGYVSFIKLQKAYKCTILCMHVRGCQPDDTGPKPCPKLPQFCKDDVQTCKNTLEASYYTFLPLAPKIRKTEAPLKHEIVALTPTNACTCLLER